MYTRPGACFAVYDMRKRKLLRHDFVGSIPHIGCIDDDGGVWGTYGIGRHGFFRYLPRTDSYEFPPDCILPDASQAADVMYSGAGPVDSFINGGDGYLYAGSALGEMIRIDPVSKTIKYLGKPVPGRRLPGMTLAEDGCIYMCGGSDNAPMLARYNRRSERFELLGEVAAKDGTTCYRCHELVVADGTAYIGETDNKNRSGYLWACAIR
jgi:streptogramin lyase